MCTHSCCPRDASRVWHRAGSGFWLNAGTVQSCWTCAQEPGRDAHRARPPGGATEAPRGAERPRSGSSMWAFGSRAAAGLLPRSASRASAWIGNLRGREPIVTCGRRGLHVTANAGAARHAVSTRAAGPHTGAQAAPAPVPGTRSAHAPGRTGWTRARGPGTRGVCTGFGPWPWG